MANTLSITELKEWYDTFNSIIEKYSDGTINTLTAPQSRQPAKKSDINKLFETIETFKADEYLKTEPQLYTDEYTIAQSGTLISRAVQATPIEETVDGILTIKCRNLATYAKGTCSKGGCNSGTCGNGTRSVGCSNNANSNGTYTRGGQGSGALSNVYYSNGSCSWDSHSNGTNSVGGKSSGTYDNGNVIDILCANLSVKG